MRFLRLGLLGLLIMLLATVVRSQINKAKDLRELKQFIQQEQNNPYLEVTVKRLNQEFAFGTLLNQEDYQMQSFAAGKVRDSWQKLIAWQTAYPFCTQIEFVPVGVLPELDQCQQNNQLITRSE